ncbi:MAG: UDP-N-acetylmuramate dehydrogenase [Candidatus Staskawiczbacteria bacterium]|nr:UDP-N-acetylmuramate dehydrogenase [Candidatus Staskawiczbacteria bacterium]
MENNVFEKLKKQLPEIQKGVLLKNYTTYRIGGPAKYFFAVKNKEDLISAMKLAKKFKLPVFILGGGSNLLVSDKGFSGLVVKINISDLNLKGNKAFAGAGVNLTKLAYTLAENGLSGFEWSAGIPGTIGGAIHGNAHAFGTKTSDLVESIEAVDLKTLKLKKFTNAQCQFSLKNSIFKKNKNLVIVSAVLKLKKEPAEQVKKNIKEFLEHRREKHPMNFPSAGSTFVNPSSVPAWYLIKKAGLSGKRIGNAQISEKHCNFIVNLQNAKAKDVLALINLAKKKVKKDFGILLEPEIQLVGF